MFCRPLQLGTSPLRVPDVGNAFARALSFTPSVAPGTLGICSYFCLPNSLLGRSLPQHHPCGEDNGTPLQYSCLENPMDGGAW